MIRTERRLERDGLAALAAVASDTYDERGLTERLGLSPGRAAYVMSALEHRGLIRRIVYRPDVTSDGWAALGHRVLAHDLALAQVALQESNLALNREVRAHRATRAHLAQCEADLAHAHRRLREMQAQAAGLATDEPLVARVPEVAVTEVLPALSAGVWK